jgi:hypothetical protein
MSDNIINLICFVILISIIGAFLYIGFEADKTVKVEYIKSCQEVMDFSKDQCEWQWQWNRER